MSSRRSLRSLIVLLGMPYANSDPVSVSTCGSPTEREQLLCNRAAPSKQPCVVSTAVHLPVGWTKCHWSSPGKLIVDGSIACANRTSRCKGVTCQKNTCELHFAFDAGITLSSGSMLTAGTVEMVSSHGRIEVLGSAAVLANGTGLCGRSTFRVEQHTGHGFGGAGHGGDGGKCESSMAGRPGENLAGQAYGDGTKPGSRRYVRQQPLVDPDFADLYGAGTGLSFDIVHSLRECCGGGAILINASEGVQLDGLLSVDAQQPCMDCSDAGVTAAGASARDHSSASLPCCNAAFVSPGAQCDSFGGASGGTVVVIGTGSQPLNGTGKVTARGGDGTAYVTGEVSFSAGGGAGGRVSVPTMSAIDTRQDTLHSVRVDVSGGKNSEGACYLGEQCECGAAGSIISTADDGSVVLSVDNGGQVTSAGSFVAGDQYTPDKLDVLQVSNGATLQQHMGRDLVAASRITLRENARVLLKRHQSIIVPDLEMTAAQIVGALAVRRVRRQLRGGRLGGSQQGWASIASDDHSVAEPDDVFVSGDRADPLTRGLARRRQARGIDPSSESINKLQVVTFTMDAISKVSGMDIIEIDEEARIRGRIEMLSNPLQVCAAASCVHAQQRAPCRTCEAPAARKVTSFRCAAAPSHRVCPASAIRTGE